MKNRFTIPLNDKNFDYEHANNYIAFKIRRHMHESVSSKDLFDKNIN